MFVETCQRLRLMKSSEAVNLGTVSSWSCMLFFIVATVTFCMVQQRIFGQNPKFSPSHMQHQDLLDESQISAPVFEKHERKPSLLAEVFPCL